MPANLENSAEAKGLEKVNFHSNLKKGNAKECLNYHTIVLISHASKVMLKILQGRLQQYVNQEPADVQAGFSFQLERERNQRSHCQHTLDHRESKRIPEKHLFLLHWLHQSLWLRATTNWKILKEMGISDHCTCLLRSLYAEQEATVRTGHRTMDWFKIGKGVCQGYILSSCLFNLYVEYINPKERQCQRMLKLLYSCTHLTH